MKFPFGKDIFCIILLHRESRSSWELCQNYPFFTVPLGVLTPLFGNWHAGNMIGTHDSLEPGDTEDVGIYGNVQWEGKDTDAAAAELVRLANKKMPFGKYAGRFLVDLPESYILWFKQKGWPEGSLGEDLRAMEEIKVNGLENLIRSFISPGSR